LTLSFAWRRIGPGMSGGLDEPALESIASAPPLGALLKTLLASRGTFLRPSVQHCNRRDRLTRALGSPL